MPAHHTVIGLVLCLALLACAVFAQDTPPNTVAPTPAPTPAPPPMEDGIKVLIVLDGKLGSATADIEDTISNHMKDLRTRYTGLKFAGPRLVTGLSRFQVVSDVLSNIQTNAPDVIIGAREVAVTDEVARATSSTGIPLLSPLVSADQFADMSLFPNVVSIAPSDRYMAVAMIDAVQQVKWESVAVLYSDNIFGFGLYSAYVQESQSRSDSPAIVYTKGLYHFMNDTALQGVAAAISNIGVKGVVMCVDEGLVDRVITAFAAAKFSPYYILPKTAMRDQSTVPIDSIMVAPLATALKANSRVTLPVPSGVEFQNNVTYMMSYVLDALEIVAVTRGNIRSGLSSVNFEGFTGTVQFANNVRLSSNFGYFQKNRDKLTEVGSWTGPNTAALDPLDAVKSSPLTMVTVCAMAVDDCVHQANLNHVLYALRDPVNLKLIGDMKMQVKLINTGRDGVRGMRQLLELGRVCNFATGPGLSSVAKAVTPIVNAYKVVEVDYSATSSELSDKFNYPFFSRTVPNDVNTARALKGVLNKFNWDQVNIIRTSESYGASFVQNLQAEFGSGIDIEQVFNIGTSITNGSVVGALTAIKDDRVSRIIIAIAIPQSSLEAKNFFDTALALGMHQTHVFILGDTLCQAAAFRPEIQQAFIGSLCVHGAYDEERYKAVYQDYLKIDAALHKQMLADSGFSTGCDMDHTDIYSAYAHDAAVTVLRAVQYAQANNLAVTNGTQLLYATRNVTFEGSTGRVKFLPSGDRIDVVFRVTSQQRKGEKVDIATWTFDDGYQADPDAIVLWMDNTTNVPATTTRSLSFRVVAEATSHPITIVIAVLGFLGVIAVIVYCYKRSKLEEKSAGVGHSDREMSHHGERIE